MRYNFRIVFRSAHCVCQGSNETARGGSARRAGRPIAPIREGRKRRSCSFIRTCHSFPLPNWGKNNSYPIPSWRACSGVVLTTKGVAAPLCSTVDVGVVAARRLADRQRTTWRRVLTAILVVCNFWAVLNGRAVTARRSTVAKTPDGGTATGAGGDVIRTPDGGTEPVTCATIVGLGVCPNANDVSVSRPIGCAPAPQ